MSIAEVRLWGRTIGAVSWNEDKALANFEYAGDFQDSGIEVSPFHMPLGPQIYTFPALSRDTFKGLPGMLADALPDDFGNALIDTWLAREGRRPESFNPVERLCYTGNRGMGALEFSPATGPGTGRSEQVDVDALVELASEVLAQRNRLEGSFTAPKVEGTLNDILRVGTSAGGARAKAIIAWNPQTNEVRSGQVEAGSGFSYWLLKLDGVSGNRDKELDDPMGYGLIEYAYHAMATAAGIEMEECRLLPDGARHHFMTRRFDRNDKGQKLHMQTLGALQHFDYRRPGAWSYEQTLRTIRQLGLPMSTVEQQFRRMAFNIIARNQDDHVKNIAFLMNPRGEWSLSPAYDITYSYNPEGTWTGSHQMSLNGKRDDFTLDDFRACADNLSMKKTRYRDILEEVTECVKRWPEFAEKAGVTEETATRITATHRLSLPD